MKIVGLIKLKSLVKLNTLINIFYILIELLEWK